MKMKVPSVVLEKAQAAVRDTIKKGLTELNIKEAIVAQPKQYSQTSDLVTSKTKDAHEVLYKGYIEAFNDVSAKLDTAKRGDAVNSKHSDFRSLKLDETYNTNAVWLHEQFFANCFDPASEIYVDSLPYMRLQRDWGTFDDWQRDFMACCKAAGEGWAVCGYNMFTKRYVNTVISHHSQDVMLGLFPVLVIDMWTHSSRDYYNDVESYVTAMIREINWDVVEERIKKCDAIAEVLK